eukprot:RCo055002
MQLDATQLANSARKTVRLCTLPPTTVRSFDFVGLAVSVVERADRLRMGPGALFSWFCESVPENQSERISVSSAKLGESPRSAMNKAIGPSRTDSNQSLPASLASCNSVFSSPSFCPTSELETPQSIAHRRTEGTSGLARPLHVSIAIPSDLEVADEKLSRNGYCFSPHTTVILTNNVKRSIFLL